MNPAIAALGVVPWKDVIKMAPQLVESARKFYDNVKARKKRDSTSADDTLTMEMLAERIDTVANSLEEDASQYATDQAELIAQLADHVEALSRGLEVMNSRQRLLTRVLAGVALIAVLATVIPFVV